MAGKTKLATWQDELDSLNEERSNLVYSLMRKGREGDWSELRRVEASDDEDLAEINQRIADHVANRPDDDG